MSNEPEESLESKKLRLEITALEDAAVQTAATNVHTNATRSLELERLTVELAQKEIDLEEKKLNLDKLKAEEAEREFKGNHLVYRFTQPVFQDAITECIEKLDLWAGLHPGAQLEVVFTSPGGSVYAGMSLFDHLRMLSRRGHPITTGAEGYAASMAGILLQAGDIRWVGKESWVLIHEIQTGDWGKTSIMEDTVEHLRRLQQRVVDIFLSGATATGATDLLSETQFRQRWTKTEWWLNSDEVLRHGFADEVR